MKNSLTKEETKNIALICGFKLKTQEDGSEDLNDYVYKFSRAIEFKSRERFITEVKATIER